MLEGLRDAQTFAYNNTRHPYNIHVYMNPARGMVLGILFMFAVYQEPFWEAVSHLISMVLMWPYFHNGFYYEGRRALDVPDYHFFAQSRTTTANLSFDFRLRAFMCLCGLLPYYI